ncbi:ankyrin repeat-containing domain protein [Tuber brumale]|nr:ankyrin repeat-containing domain protein [Tuber brumale]
MSLLSLPNELLLEIYSYQSLQDAYSFLRTNRLLATIFRYALAKTALRAGGLPAARRALYSAAGRRDIPMIEYLVENRIFRFVDKNTLLHDVAEIHSPDVMEALLDTCDLDVESVNYKGRSVLSAAVAVGAVDIVKLLLHRVKNINLNSQDRMQFTPLHIASSTNLPSIPALLLLLLHDPRTDPTLTNQSGQTPLHVATSRGHEVLVPLLLQHPSVDPNRPDGSGRTPLLIACDKGFDGIVKVLLEHPRIEVNAANEQGWTPLNVAILWGRADVVRRLLADERVHCDTRAPRFCWTGLHMAVAGRRLEVLEVLLADRRVRKDLTAVDEGKDTPVQLAVKSGIEEAVEILRGCEGEIQRRREGGVM